MQNEGSNLVQCFLFKTQHGYKNVEPMYIAIINAKTTAYCDEVFLPLHTVNTGDQLSTMNLFASNGLQSGIADDT